MLSFADHSLRPYRSRQTTTFTSTSGRLRSRGAGKRHPPHPSCANMGREWFCCLRPPVSAPLFPEWSFAMRPADTRSTRRDFLQASASAVATISAAVPTSRLLAPFARPQSGEEMFLARQEERRKKLWGLLGDLPWEHKPGPARLVSQEEHQDYRLERL